MRRLKEIIGWVACYVFILVCVLVIPASGLYCLKLVDDSHVAKRTAAGEVQHDGFSTREVTISGEEYIVFQSSRGIHAVRKERKQCVTH